MSYLIRRIQGLGYLIWGPDLIDRAYSKVTMHEVQFISPKHNTWQAQGKPFKVSTPANDHLLLTSMHLIMELVEAPRQRLSLHAVAKEVCSVTVVFL